MTYWLIGLVAYAVMMTVWWAFHKRISFVEMTTQSESDRYEQTIAARDAQIAILAENQAAYLAMKKEVDEIALFLRNSYARQIAMGQHAGRSLSEVVIGYLTGKTFEAPVPAEPVGQKEKT